jgi:hypothetical protein
MEYYQLDPAHNYSSPGTAWEECLKMSQVKLELLTDLDMHLFFEKGIRGGISMVSQRYAKANNPLVPDYDPSKPKSWIIDIDANGLYAEAMCRSLPYGGFEWSSDTIDTILSTPGDSDHGYVLEVDLEYPPELHDSHASYPLAPEVLRPQQEWLSDYQRKLLHDDNFNDAKKLIPNFMPKKNYVIHYSLLQLYISLGLKLTKVHKIVKFKQKPWMKSFIDFNIEKRTIYSAIKFLNVFFKNKNNAVFGKTMENVRNRLHIELVHTKADDAYWMKVISKSNIDSITEFDNGLVAVNMLDKDTLLNKPIYVGQAILDLSKLHMYNFYYKKIKPIYEDRVKVLYTDTDSLILYIETGNVYNDLVVHRDLFDLSNYPVDSVYRDLTNEGVVGKFKDETAGVPISEFVGLRPKMYAFKTETKEERRAKGVNKATIEKELKFDVYKEVLVSGQSKTDSQMSIKSKKHKLAVYFQDKISLSALDTKRYILPDGINMLPYGHYALPPGCSMKSGGS